MNAETETKTEQQPMKLSEWIADLNLRPLRGYSVKALARDFAQKTRLPRPQVFVECSDGGVSGEDFVEALATQYAREWKQRRKEALDRLAVEVRGDDELFWRGMSETIMWAAIRALEQEGV